MRVRRAIDGVRGDLRGRALAVVVGCLICQMGLGFGYVLGPLAKDIIGELGWSRGDFSLARLLQLGAMAAASPAIGMLTVRHGARVVLATATVALSVLFFVMAHMESLYTYWLLMIGVGIALTGVGDVAVGHTVSRWVARRRGVALGLVFVGSNLGGVLFVPAAVATSEAADWRTAMTVLGAVGLLVLLPASLLLVRNPSAPVVSTHDRSDVGDTAMETGADLDLGEAMHTRSFWILLLSLFTFFFYQLSLLEHMVLFFTDEGLSRSDAAARFATAIGFGIVSKLGLGLVADRLDEHASIVIVYAGLTLSSLLLLLHPDSVVVWAFVVSFGLSYPARDIVHPLIVIRCFGLRNMASIYGALMVVLVLGGAGPYFAGAVHDRTGSYQLAFVVFAALNGVTLISLLFLRNERRPRSHAPFPDRGAPQA